MATRPLPSLLWYFLFCLLIAVILNVFVNKSAARASDDELSQRFRSRSETPQRPGSRSQGQGQGQTGGSEIDTSSYRHNLLGGGY